MGDFLEEMNLHESLNDNHRSFSPSEEASMSCKPGSSFTEAQGSGPHHAGLEAGLFLPYHLISALSTCLLSFLGTWSLQPW